MTAQAAGSLRPRRGKTKWGDRAARRQDILDAARTQIHDSGYLALNMRDIAAGAGVSTGTLYSYFATKEEIYATLYAEEIERHNERIAPLCREAPDLETFLYELTTAFVDLYETYGRHFALWSALAAEAEAADAPLPRDLTLALRSATIHQGELVASALRRLCATDGLALDDMRSTLALLWSTMNGILDHLCSERHRVSGVEADGLIRFSARVLAAGLVAPAAVS